MGRFFKKITMNKTIIFLLICFFISGCRSIPEDKTRRDWMSLLPSDASFYFIIDFKETSRTIVNEIAGNFMVETSGLDFLFERTNVIYGAVTVSENDGPLISDIILLGKYPRGAINSIIKDKWTKNEAAIDYWSNEDSRIKICLPERYMIFFSNGDILPIIENYDSPEPFSYFSIDNIDIDKLSDYEMVLVFPNFTGDGFSEKVGLRTVINQLLVSADLEQTDNEVAGIFNLEKQSSIGSFNQVLRLMIVYILRGYRIEGLASRLKEIEIEASGTQMQVHGLPLSSEELAGLLVNMINKRTEQE